MSKKAPFEFVDEATVELLIAETLRGNARELDETLQCAHSKSMDDALDATVHCWNGLEALGQT